MRNRTKWIAAVAVALLVLAAAVATRGMGLSARRSPWPGEERMARLARAWTLPGEYRSMTNPVELTPEALRAGMAHWANHCAMCHGNDGSGQIEIGRGLFPPAPDMRAAGTQELSDGALFYAIEEGIPFTGMPGWSTGTEDGRRDSWELVLFIRHLPQLTPAEIREMEALNPKSAADLERERQIQEFLKGGGS
jgi:mono/diheme cytochrome c family protein